MDGLQKKAAKLSELKMNEDKVRDEPLSDVNVVGHWAYLFAVTFGRLVSMVGLTALGMGSQ